MNKKEKHILAVIKRIRDSFTESVATYTCGRCYHFACILKEIFDGELYRTEDKNHVITKIGEKFYDIYGDCEFRYYEEDQKSYTKIKEDDVSLWDGNYHGVTVDMFMKKYRK